MTAPSSPSSRPPPHGIALAAIGASAGGVEALLQILGELPPRFRLPIVAVLHLPDERNSRLVEVFGQRVALAVHEAAPGEPILPGHLYFAPPGYHLLVEADRSFSLSCEAPVLFSRPSIDVLLDSAAHAYRERLAAMLLTGASADGAAGLAQAGALGGFTAVQDPASARVATMPAAALALRQPDRVLDLPGLRRLLIELDETSPC
ncbi:chemotaxis protein CheB [Xylophilus sp. ASV27]|uniref:chemotaxis protein CheB n=1 Tax=Xylophilus sp. ASV27 TaxID=2795129 RepID=UPI0018EA8BBC|nr:chemotaxis protein CheB [Xylophilus sp. ASV27]